MRLKFIKSDICQNVYFLLKFYMRMIAKTNRYNFSPANFNLQLLKSTVKNNLSACVIPTCSTKTMFGFYVSVQVYMPMWTEIKKLRGLQLLGVCGLY